MYDLASLNNSLVSNTLYYCDGNPYLMPVFLATAFTSEMTYSMLSKINIGTSPRTRFDHYVLEYKKANKASSEEKFAIVTGANSGIGFETAKALALAGFHVIMACRNKESTEEAISKLELETGLKTFEFMQLDLSSFKSIDAFVEQYKKSHDKLHLLVNNAGVMMCPYSKTKDGIENQFGTNHLGHFKLTIGLLDLIKASERARIVVLSSLANYTGTFDKSLILDESKYNPVVNYGISKLCNIMFANELARRLAGTGVTVNSLHPGSVNTNLSRYIPGNSLGIMETLKSLILISPTAGALTSIKVALDPKLEGVTGKYFSYEEEATPLGEALDEQKCKELWDFSEELIKKHST
ncbi:Short-chain dehydrogenase TIC 32, chloroplastic [Smittium mucronatum]|uniref:Short-chain dehydrogenase TIC 32, chloroplastic n=1 Tax=Smittium mucronatum TaxID=133383 RepID=A0A1R0GXV8_9FUNG|nr:Short-chain dehydrogenase TIC 32, chloroplastic [Smittium mucronatum]OLY81675.1 Short-chain dehydrogenase TIC 32, chloroplastic [Smittium mucronatum]